MLFKKPMMRIPKIIVTVSMYSRRIQREQDRLAKTITKVVAKILNIHKTGMFLISVSNAE
jgi:GTP cyclohydrolase I